MKNIDKAIYYFQLSEKNDTKYYCACDFLGIIYANGVYVKRNLNKAIHCFLKAANNYNLNAYHSLGVVYLHQNNIKKAIEYFSFASDKKNSESQYYLGIIYLKNELYKNIDKAMHYLILSAENGNKNAQFVLGVIYSNNKYSKKDINKAIRYYKNANNLYESSAKNNLAIIHLNCIKNNESFAYAIELLQEATQLKNSVAMYNLANICIYNDFGNNNFDPIDLLMVSSESFWPSKQLLCLALIKKHKINSTAFNDMINSLNGNLAREIYEIIDWNNLGSLEAYQEFYLFFKNKYYAYDENYNIELFDTFIAKEPEYKKVDSLCKELTKDFYEGFNFI